MRHTLRKRLIIGVAVIFFLMVVAVQMFFTFSDGNFWGALERVGYWFTHIKQQI